ILQKYAMSYRNIAENKVPLPSHIFQLANNAYYHMRCIVYKCFIFHSGKTGSGKSESHHLAIKTLQVPAAGFVIESFGNACMLFNPNVSHFGKYTELQFTNKGCLCGIKSLDYYLECN
ncbi:P-loop containing nucleoside triphosphate hydrolase protein, partial [Boletus coccyginus]